MTENENTKLAVATMKLAKFYVTYAAIVNVICLASLATAWMWFGWKMAVVIFLTEVVSIATSQRRVQGDKYADELEKKLGL